MQKISYNKNIMLLSDTNSIGNQNASVYMWGGGALACTGEGGGYNSELFFLVYPRILKIEIWKGEGGGGVGAAEKIKNKKKMLMHVCCILINREPPLTV